ncbi:hypothetical protein J6590_012164 [Homalodisca vitripennis]|nr:hypothetical protein J6590_012164 [Homalodisca vitripennis]
MTSPSSPKNLPNDLKSQLEGFNTDNMKKADTNEKIVLPTAEDVKQEKQHNQLIHSVENFKADKLKRTNTLEKIVLPNAEGGILAGRQEIHDLQGRRSLLSVAKCVFTLSAVIRRHVVKTEAAMLDPTLSCHRCNATDSCDSHPCCAQLGHSHYLPCVYVAAEKSQKALIEDVEGFDTGKLKHAQTQEKNPLPDKFAVLQEKQHLNLIEGVEHFDKSTMKHTETQEKNPLPGTQAIEAEKGQQQLIAGIENFDTTKLKHTETLEKNPLPTKEGTNN